MNGNITIEVEVYVSILCDNTVRLFVRQEDSVYGAGCDVKENGPDGDRRENSIIPNVRILIFGIRSRSNGAFVGCICSVLFRLEETKDVFRSQRIYDSEKRIKREREG